MRLHRRIVLGLLVMTVGTFFVAIIAIRFLTAPSRATLSSITTINAGGPTATSPGPTLLLCPTAGLAPLRPSSRTGHHKVTLSWNASAPSSAFESKAVGYCLYRSQTPKAAKQNPICSRCEQINFKPIAGIGCVDDLVEDGADYYYVVTAISANGKISSSSNETSARIPRNKEALKSVSTSSYPACREPVAQQ